MQDGPALNETSSKRGLRLSTTFKRSHDRLDASRSGPPSADLDRPRVGKVPAVLGLVALTAVTSWVVASISVWLVPVYMTAMVLIFAAPRATHPVAPAAASEAPAIEPVGGDEPTADADSGEAPGAAVESSASDADEGIPKPRKRRGRRKRSAKLAEADAAFAEVKWVRVGPGKFVRADVQDPATEATGEGEGEGAVLDSPTTEDGTTDDPGPPEEPGSLERPEPSEVEAPETTAEEYGIAPSALGEGQEAAVLPEDVDRDEPVPVPEPEHEPDVDASLASQAIPSKTAMRDCGPIRPAILLAPSAAESGGRRRLGTTVAFSGPRNVRRDDASRARSSTRNGRAADVRLRHRSDRIRGRLIHVERDYQPRSPPSRA
jgi:hypothetical protein